MQSEPESPQSQCSMSMICWPCVSHRPRYEGALHTVTSHICKGKLHRSSSVDSKQHSAAQACKSFQGPSVSIHALDAGVYFIGGMVPYTSLKGWACTCRRSRRDAWLPRGRVLGVVPKAEGRGAVGSSLPALVVPAIEPSSDMASARCGQASDRRDQAELSPMPVRVSPCTACRLCSGACPRTGSAGSCRNGTGPQAHCQRSCLTGSRWGEIAVPSSSGCSCMQSSCLGWLSLQAILTAKREILWMMLCDSDLALQQGN